MKPVKVFKVGPNVGSVFRNEYGYTVNLHRRYQDRESQEWKSTSAFRLSDLPQVALVLQLATAYVAEREAVGQQNGGGEPADESTPEHGQTAA